MTGQSLLDRMELINQELQLQSGEANVTKGLLALNVAQDYFEAIAAVQPDIFGGALSTITTVADQEYTAWPSGLLRLDGLDYIDPTTSRPAWPVHNLHQTGSHAYANVGIQFNYTNPSDAPQSYWTNGTRIYWSPLPSAVHTVRYYGFAAASDITAGGTFAYPDVAAFPIAIFAAKIIKLGVDDPAKDLSDLAGEVFNPVIKALSNYNRDGAPGLHYTTVHNS